MTFPLSSSSSGDVTAPLMSVHDAADAETGEVAASTDTEDMTEVATMLDTESCAAQAVPSELPMQMTLSAFAQAGAFEEPWTPAPERAGNYDEALRDGMGDAVSTAVKFVDGGARSSTGWRFAGCGREHLVRPGVSWCYVCRK